MNLNLINPTKEQARKQKILKRIKNLQEWLKEDENEELRKKLVCVLGYDPVEILERAKSLGYGSANEVINTIITADLLLRGIEDKIEMGMLIIQQIMEPIS